MWLCWESDFWDIHLTNDNYKIENFSTVQYGTVQFNLKLGSVIFIHCSATDQRTWYTWYWQWIYLKLFAKGFRSEVTFK